MEWTVGYWQISVQRVYPTNEQLSQMYNAAAPRWQHLIDRLGVNHAYAQLFQSLHQSGVLAHLQEGSIVCDCGMGTAAFSLALVKTLRSNLQVTGVDISPKMLDQAHPFLRQAGVNPTLCCGDVNALPFQNNSFDLIISAHMFEHLSDPAKGLQEMVRVLRPGSPLILVVTRPGLLGWWIQWHWGNGCFPPKELIKIMSESKLTNICSYSLTAGLSQWTSMAYVGFKPFL
jgi:ubiquinone/menaquinone biosynthesis C-methylase UbiE